jgi:hypothetical protein
MWLKALFGGKDKSATANLRDKVLITRAGKEKVITGLVQANPATRLVYWFRETGQHYRQLLESAGLPTQGVIDARTIRVDESSAAQIVFIERYPMAAKEVETLANWPDQTYPAYSSLDEPLFLHFGSERIAGVMKSLGMKDDEAVEHGMISQSLARGQEKIANQVSFDQGANSQSEWMRKHIQGEMTA